MCPAISEHLFMIDPFFGFRSDGGLGTEEKKLVEKEVRARTRRKVHVTTHAHTVMYTCTQFILHLTIDFIKYKT